ncbi:tyrosine-type recombinase/integrase [Terriglobus aquaticus]|uniref:Tyrosine-type recombinase/integrase n=1 Tax=Terriglobus aquaticus TaxID=940139 RepID=A0ABW9KJU8_9BACT|nr:site-specific integrase [Terriglobus aquaticus]
MKNKTAPDTWFFRYREDSEGRRSYRNLKIGTVRDLPHRRDAEKAVLTLRVNINSGVRTPETVNDAIAHYSKIELVPERKSHATLENVRGILRLHIAPKWGGKRLTEVRTVLVEEWLHSMPLAPGTRSKIRNVFSALFSHAIRYEWTDKNPIQKVRASSARLADPDVLSPDEFRALLPLLEARERAMVMLAGSTGLRRSEMFALRWSDVCFVTMQVHVTKGVVRNHFGATKTPASRKPVPLHDSVATALLEWRRGSMYRDQGDFLFPSVRLNGTQPLFPDMVLKKFIRPAAKAAGLTKRIGWHTFRHSLATNLRSLGVDVKVAQELLRHANSRTTLDLYTRAVSADKREANARTMHLLMGETGLHRRAPSAVAA